MPQPLTASRPTAASADYDSSLALLRRFGINSFSACLLYDTVRRFPLERTQGFVGYLDSRRTLVAIGEPVCSPADWGLAIDEFAEMARAENKHVTWIAVGEAFLRAAMPSRPTWLYLGEDFLYDVPTYAPRGDPAKKVRSARNQLLRGGARVREVTPHALAEPALSSQLRDVAASWLRNRGTFQMHLLDLDLLELADLKRIFLIESERGLLGFLSCLPIFGRHGYLLEDLVRHPSAPIGTTEFLVLAAVEALRRDGCEVATFGLSPRVDPSRSNLAGASRALATLGVRLANRFAHLDRLYHYRKKYGTRRSEPCYLVKQPFGVGIGDVWGILRAFNLA